MFADLVDIGFDEVLKTIKESVQYHPEMEDSEYSDLYINLMKTPFKKYKCKTYYRRASWPETVFIRLDIISNDFKSDVPDDYQDLSIKEIIEKLDNDEIKLCIKLVYCNIENDKPIEDHIIAVNHVVNNIDILAEDWCCYCFE